MLATLVEWLKSHEQQPLSRALAVWVGKVILGRLPGDPVTGVNDLQEMRKVLSDRIEEWGEEFKREGRQEGRQAGEAAMLLRLLRKRFGELPEWVPTRLQQANPDQLERWGERLLEVDSLDGLFDPE